MYFGSDNCGPAHPDVMQALVDANAGYQASYGNDTIMEQVRDRIRAIFEAPRAAVYLVATGTAANSLALATMAQPWQTIFCAPLAHIQVDECHAPEFYTGGSKLSLVGEGDKMTPDALSRTIQSWAAGDVHVSQRGPVSITQVTERGHVYALDELSALTDVARQHRLPVHMDGARFANAITALECTPAQMTWAIGVDAVSFGGTKNGCLGVEAVVFFNPDHAWEFELRRKRGAHLFSKHRYLSAQMLAYLNDGLWLTLAKKSNGACARLAEGLRSLPDCHFVAEPQANLIFATLPRATHQRLHAAGAIYGMYDGPVDNGDPDEPLMMRLVCDWSTTDEYVDRFIAAALG